MIPFIEIEYTRTFHNSMSGETDLNRNVMLCSYLSEYEGSDCIGCIALICIVFNDKPSMQLRLMIIFMFVLRRNLKSIWRNKPNSVKAGKLSTVAHSPYN